MIGNSARSLLSSRPNLNMSFHSDIISAAQLANEGHHEKAAGILKSIIALEPSGNMYVGAALLLSQIEFLSPDRTQQSLKLAENCLVANDQISLCWKIAGDCLARLGYIGEALTSYKQAANKNEMTKEIISLMLNSVIASPGTDYLSKIPAIHNIEELNGNDFSDLIKAIFSMNRDDIFEKFKIFFKNNYYNTPIVETFYMKHALVTCGQFKDRIPPNAGRPSISLSSLHHHGRFSHTVNNYLAAKLFADRHGYVLQTPEWPGHYFFDLSDPFISQDRKSKTHIGDIDILTRYHEGDGAFPSSLEMGRSYDIFSPDTHVLFEKNRIIVQNLLTVRPLWKQIMEIPLTALRKDGRKIIAMHIRLGDMELEIHKRYGSINYKAYLTWVDEMMKIYQDASLFIASDEPEKAKEIFARYNPKTLEDLPANLPIIPHLQDFYILMNSDALAISRGGFGKMAAALNQTATGFFRQSADGEMIVPFSPWTR